MNKYKRYSFFIFLFFIISCSSNKDIYYSKKFNLIVKKITNCEKSNKTKLICAFKDKDYSKTLFYYSQISKKNVYFKRLAAIAYFYLGNLAETESLLIEASDYSNLRSLYTHLGYKGGGNNKLEARLISLFYERKFIKIVNNYNEQKLKDTLIGLKIYKKSKSILFK